MTDTELELPQGWAETNVGIICKNYDKQRIPINAKKRKLIQGKIPYYGASGIVDYVEKPIFSGKYFLIGEDGANLISRSTPIGFIVEGDFWVNNHAHILSTYENIPLEFLSHYIASISLKPWISGTAQPKLNQENLRKIPVPLPPLNEQKRIVSKIEELFSRINSTKQSLEQTKLQLELYKLSFLESIFSEFEQKPLSRIAKIISGYSFKSKDFIHEGIPVIKISNISYGKFIEKNQEFLPISYLKKFEDFVVKPKNILIALTRPITNDTVKICEYPEDNPISLLNQRVAKIELLNKFPRKLILYYFQSHNFKDQIIQNMTGTEQPNLSPLKLANFLCPFPPLEKQDQIVSQIEQGFSLIENTTQIVESTLQKLQTMKMSVLKQAFEGKLVQQDPNDEPASVLLERIKLKN